MHSHELAKKNVNMKKGEIAMTIEKALSLSTDEFIRLSDECNGFNDEMYKNHPIHTDDETIIDFLLKGSQRIKDNPAIRGNLI